MKWILQSIFPVVVALGANPQTTSGTEQDLIGGKGLEKQLANWFKNARVEFIEGTIERTFFTGNIALETAGFAIKSRRWPYSNYHARLLNSC